MSWAAEYIEQDIPWVAGVSDCWSFARRVWFEVFGISVPIIDVDAHNRLQSAKSFLNEKEVTNWYIVDEPEDGDAVLMGKNSYPSHIGIWSDAEQGIIHSVKGVGVIFSAPPYLCHMGLRVLGYYRRKV